MEAERVEKDGGSKGKGETDKKMLGDREARGGGKSGLV
jgi:hypothetical protein